MKQAIQRASRGRLNLAVTIASTIAIAAFANMLLSGTRLRADLTENRINVLSEASQEAAAALEDLEVRVYISPDMPESVPMGGREVTLQGVPQKLLDKLSEYQAWAPSMVITKVSEDLLAEAERNRLRPFTGKGGAISESGRFEFKRYVLGLTMHHRNQTEVFELALEPEHFEFELTRRLVRLKEKAEFAVSMKDVIEAAQAVGDATKACVAALEKADAGGEENPLAALGGEGADKQLTAMRAEARGIGEACGKLAEPLTKAKAVPSTLEAFKRVELIADALRQESEAFVKGLEASDPNPANAAQLTQSLKRLVAIGKAVDEEVRGVEDAPGQKRIGFVCNAGTFCPFPDATPLYQRELARGVANQEMMQQALGFLDQLQQQVNMLLEQIGQGFFRGRGFDIVRVDLDADLPDDLAALVVYGPTGDFSDWQLHQLDQFVLRGGSLVAFLQPWDVGLQLMGRGGKPEKPSMTRRSSNLEGLLTHYGLKPSGALVVEPKAHGEVSLMQYLQQGDRLIPFQSVPLPYPMLPTLKEMDRTDPLVRATPTMTLPFTTWFELTPTEGVTTAALVSSSSEAASVDSATFPLDPELQVAEALKAPAGKPLAAVAASRGKYTSYFKGKTRPTKPAKAASEAEDKPEDKPERAKKPDLDAGEGRVLAVGSGLGLTSLAREVIFEGFKPEDALGQGGELFMKLEDFRLRFENWETRLSQVQHTLQGNLQFLQNALDWSVQRGAIAELRSKQYTERPLAITNPDEAGLERALGISLPTTLLLVFGAFWTLRKKARVRRLSA
jgi:ABC-type uncharacterized transport system involved in gliding motility auxiliary subunit